MTTRHNRERQQRALSRHSEGWWRQPLLLGVIGVSLLSTVPYPCEPRVSAITAPLPALEGAPGRAFWPALYFLPRPCYRIVPLILTRLNSAVFKRVPKGSKK